MAGITSRQRGLPFHVPLDPDCGLRTPSWVQSESVRAISVERVIRQLGRARAETVTEVPTGSSISSVTGSTGDQVLTYLNA